jgi:hypothetical protein
MAARWKAAKANREHPFSSATKDAFREAYEVGCSLEADLFKQWPRSLGRRPPVAVDLAIEVFFADEFSDSAIRSLIQMALEEGTLAIPGVSTTKVNDRYVTRRRELSGIRRRRAISV